MAKYILRLDDAAPCADWAKWDEMEQLLDKYGIKPLVGVIPDCKDEKLNSYEKRSEFWDMVHRWKNKGWTIAMHGYDHVYLTTDGGINPVNRKSEFAGVDLRTQKEKIRTGVAILREQNIDPEVFFAPSHTFDLNTIRAIKEESNIRIISDTVANDSYSKYGMTFVPQQSGRVRKLPFRTVTFCYHPNMCDMSSYRELEVFLQHHGEQFIGFPLEKCDREESMLDKSLSKLYFMRKSI